MNILVTLNSGYVKPLCTMLKSFIHSNRGTKTQLYIIHSSLTLADFQAINKVTLNSSVTLKPIRVEASLFSNAPTCKRISKETYYRIFASKLLPENLDRILYIDPDTVILNRLDDFYNADFGKNAIIGAKHFDGAVDLWNRKRLFIKNSQSYINAGVMLCNLEEMRRIFNSQTVFSIIKKRRRTLFLADQDVINIMYDGKIGLFDENIINLDERCFARMLKSRRLADSIDFVEANTMIIHYNGKYKPWKPDYKGKLDKYWHFFDEMHEQPEGGYLFETA